MNDIKISLNVVAAITGAVLIATYIIFGGSFPSKETPKRKTRKKGTIPGLANIGNTCFLNCILQAIAACPSFMKWLDYKARRSPPILLCTLNKIIRILNNKTEDNVANAYDVLKALRSHGWVISPEEQDAHELFHALTSTINDEISLIKQQSNSLLNVSWIKLEKDQMDLKLNMNGCSDDEHNFSISDSSNQSDLKVLESSKGSFSHILEVDEQVVKENENDVSIISKVPFSLKKNYNFLKCSEAFEIPFKGHLASQLKCGVCGFKNAEQWSTFESISLSLPNSSWSCQKCSLIELLDAFVLPEFVTDVTCEGCSKVRGRPSQSTFTKQLTIGKLPDCLCIHIQRTIWLENGCVVKRKDFINIPEILNMEPFTYTVSINNQYSHNCRMGLLGGRESSDSPNENFIKKEDQPKSFSSHFTTLSSNKIDWRNHSLYKLQAVVVHVGDVFSGHFITYRRGPVDSNLRDRWFYTSDVIVKEVFLDEVLQSNAYMVLYERISMPF